MDHSKFRIREYGEKMKRNKNNQRIIGYRSSSIGNKLLTSVEHVSDGRIVTEKQKSILVSNAVRRAVTEYGEVLRKLADE